MTRGVPVRRVLTADSAYHYDHPNERETQKLLSPSETVETHLLFNTTTRRSRQDAARISPNGSVEPFPAEPAHERGAWHANHKLDCIYRDIRRGFTPAHLAVFEVHLSQGELTKGKAFLAPLDLAGLEIRN